jgi:hypothetical protein
MDSVAMTASLADANSTAQSECVFLYVFYLKIHSVWAELLGQRS